MEIDLHRSEKLADWEKVEPSKRNFFQRWAARTKGIVTPGNAVSVAGVAVFFDGLYDFSQGQRASGIAKMLVGKVFDYGDGAVAAATETKSRTGEAVDATCDTATVLGALVVAGSTEAVPLVPLALISARNVGTIAVTVYAKARGQEIHATKEAKINQFVQWPALGAFMVASSVDVGMAQDVANTVGYMGTTITVPLGTYGTYKGYVESLPEETELVLGDEPA